MKLFIQFSLLILSLLNVESKYEIIFDRIEQLDDGKFWDLGTIRVTKFNRSTAVATGVGTIKIPIDNSYEFAYEAYNLSGGQYKKIFGKSVGNACDVAYEATMKDEVLRIIAATNTTTKYGDCPVNPQTISLKDYYTKDSMVPEYVPGNERWRVHISLTKENVVYGELAAYVILRDNDKLFNSKWRK